MDTLILFGATLIGLFLAFLTCNGLVQQIGANDTPIDLRSGVLDAVAVLGLWMLTNLTGWAWSPRAIQAVLHAATPVEMSIASMLVVSWIVLPGFVLGLMAARVWHVLKGRGVTMRKTQ